MGDNCKYEAVNIPYYVMADVETKAVEVFQFIDGSYQRQPLNQSKPYRFVIKDCSFDLVFDNIWE